MQRFVVLAMAMMGCGVDEVGAPEVGTWERPTWNGIERLTLADDGTFTFHAPDVYPELFHDTTRAAGHYVVNGDYLELRGFTRDGVDVRSMFTFATDGDVLVRGAVVRDRERPDHWYAHAVSWFGDYGEEKDWTITEYSSGNYDLAYHLQDSVALRYSESSFGTWIQREDEIRYDDGDHIDVNVEVTADSRRPVPLAEQLAGLRAHAISHNRALLYTRTVRLQ